MHKNEDDELQKHTLHLFPGDYARLAELFPAVKPAKVIRHLVRDLIQRTAGEKPNIEINMDDFK